MPEEIGYVTGAVIKYEKINEEQNEISLYDHDETYFCTKSIQIKVGQGYKFGVKEVLPSPLGADGKPKRRFEIVSIEQVILKNPAFEATANVPIAQSTSQTATVAQPVVQVKVVQMPIDDYRDLVSQKSIRIKESCLKTALDVVKEWGEFENVGLYVKEVVRIANELEQYFG
jgi:hypothetical protein